MAFLLLLSIVSIFLRSKSSAELITSLPGQPEINVGFKQYSGYIITNAEHGRALFYYFVEAQSPDPSSRPLTLWLNGGPGCSSVGFGAFMEHGPFKPGQNGSLIKNDYSWNLESNMLYVESPIGVGFSYSNTRSDYENWNDTQTAQENLQFLLNWYEEFPQHRNSDLFLTGESYAGHYIPQLAALLLDYNDRPDTKQIINLKAIALGNPLLDLDISVRSEDFLWAHGVITDRTRQLLKKECNASRSVREAIYNHQTDQCIYVEGKSSSEMGDDTQTDDLLLPICVSKTSVNQLDIQGIRGRTRSKVGDPCLNDRIFTYLNRPEVQRALYANTTNVPSRWKFCGGPLQYQYENVDTNLIPLIEDLIMADIPIWFYSGDQDTKIPLTQTRIIANKVASHLGLLPFTDYGPWYNKKQIGGWSQSFGSFLGQKKTLLTFATVRGGAHEVPFTSPSQALTLFRSFLNGSPLRQRE
ncbi:serine carboxypeptidase-like 46 [Punica granatum]|uniref:Carboxypeptidase n=1 Tax=Punica granatum TaxID=22663 RepID=A0A218WP06_PUNGR|nr:serine carboxypeptidase-like 46 [Punica granatum]OWM73971.1 hypothetical protein CDL15_Pgr022242 [Punica granatum]